MRAARLSIRTKLLASSLVLVALAGAISLLAIVRLGDVKRQGDALYQTAYTPTIGAVRAAALSKDLALQGMTYNFIVASHGGDVAAAQKDPRTKSILPAIAKDQKGLAGVRTALAAAPTALARLGSKLNATVARYNTKLAALLKLPPTDPRAARLEAELNEDVATIDAVST